MGQSARDTGILVAVCVLIFFTNLGAAPLWDRDEPRNAGCTAEMLARGDWVVPTFNDELRGHKPILLYWLMMVSYSIFGINEFGARFVSAAAGLGTVLLTYQMARQLFASSRMGQKIALWSGVILASTVMFTLASRAATPDALLIFCGTLAIYFYIRGTFGGSDNDEAFGGTDSRRLMPTGANLFGMYAAMGLGLLAKGPVGMVLPTAVVGMYLLIVTLKPLPPSASRTAKFLSVLRPFSPLHFFRTCWLMRPISALAIALAVALPWYIWVHIKTNGAWTTEFFLTHNVGRASASMEGHSGPPIMFYVVAILAGFFPWSIFTIPAFLSTGNQLRGRSNREKNEKCGQELHTSTPPPQRRALVLLLCWVGVYISIFSIAKTKLPSYVTPCYPALAILFGHFVSRWSERLREVIHPMWLKVALAHWIAIGITVLIALPIAAHRLLPGSEWLGVIGSLPFVGGILCWRWISQRRIALAQTGIACTAIGFVVLMMGVMPREIGRHRADTALLQQVREHQGPVVAFGRLEPSLVFYAKKPIREFVRGSEKELAAYLVENPDTLLLTTDQQLSTLSGKIAKLDEMLIVSTAEYFLKDESLVLLNNPTSTLANRKSESIR